MAEVPEPRPFPASLCHRCQGCRYVTSAKGSTFLMCERLPVRYLPQPVLTCPAFLARGAA
jgi:hypothetical protein